MLKALVISFLLASTLQAQTAPTQASSNGFSKIAFDEEFTTLSLAAYDTTPYAYNWYPGIWWESHTPWNSLITDTAGVLTLEWTRNEWKDLGLCDTSLEGENTRILPGKSFRYGYFEARMKWDTVTGAWPAFWLLPEQGINANVPTGEIDIFEGQGGSSTYFGTLHTWLNSKQTWYSSPNSFATPNGTDYSQWHTYGALWTAPANGQPGRVTWYLDNLAVGSASTTSLFDQQNFFLVLGAQEGIWGQCAPLTDGSPAQMGLSVDWVRVWGK